MTKPELERRLCALVTEVGEKMFKDREPHDCFCDDYAGGFVMSEKIVERIEATVRDRIELREGMAT